VIGTGDRSVKAAGRLTWTVEVGRLDPVSGPTHAVVTVRCVDADLLTTGVVCQALVLRRNYTRIVGRFVTSVL